MLKQVSYGKGIYLYDQEGRRYLDACSGAIVANLGHGVDELAEAALAQMKKVSFAFRTHFTSEPVEELRREVLKRCTAYAHAIFCNSGSEAMEMALRLARLYWLGRQRPEKRQFLSRWISYHGITKGALEISGHGRRRAQFNNVLGARPFVAPAYCHRCSFNLQPGNCALQCAGDLERKISQSGADTISAFVAEPVVGASGAAIPPRSGYFAEVRRILKRHEVLFIADEVITGFGRLGTWMGLDRFGEAADIAVIGKGLGAGYTPIAAVLMTEDVLRHARKAADFDAGVTGHTLSENPVSAAVAARVIRYLEDHHLLENVRDNESLLLEGLRELARRHSCISQVRGMGFLCGVEFAIDHQCFPDTLDTIVKECFEQGLLVYPVPQYAGCVRRDAILIAPPLITTDAQIHELCGLLSRALDRLADWSSDLDARADPDGSTQTERIVGVAEEAMAM